MKLNPTEIKKIAVFRALQLGDMLCAIPAIKALRNAYPKAEICLLGLPWGKSLTERFGNYFDRFIWFPGFPGLPEQEFDAGSFADFLNGIVKEEFDLVLQMQGNGSLVNPMIELFGAKYTAGFVKEGLYAPEKGYFIEYPDHGHEIERHLKLMEFLGITSQGTDLEFPLTQKDYSDFAEADLGLAEKQYVCIHPGSRGVWRQWPPQYFAKLADLVAENGLTPVITGTKEELGLVGSVASEMKHRPFIAAGKTSMGAVAVLLKRSCGLISNCTGVSHIAAALKVPSVVISLDGEAGRWAPLNTKLHYTTDWTRNPDYDQIREATLQMLTRS